MNSEYGRPSDTVLRVATDLCHQNVTGRCCPRDVLSYLFRVRGLDEAVIREAKVGYCDELTERVINERHYQSGDIYNIYYRSIRNRLVIPITDDCGRIVAIATRVPNHQVKGWRNTSFPKDCYLYGMDMARTECLRQNKGYLVEGYIDVLTCRQFGLKNVFAGMRAGLTENQLGVVLRYCKNLCVCFDTDPDKEVDDVVKRGAGQQGAEQVVKRFGKFFDKITQICLPVGQDPDSFIRKQGLQHFLSLESDAVMI